MSELESRRLLGRANRMGLRRNLEACESRVGTPFLQLDEDLARSASHLGDGPGFELIATQDIVDPARLGWAVLGVPGRIVRQIGTVEILFARIGFHGRLLASIA